MKLIKRQYFCLFIVILAIAIAMSLELSACDDSDGGVSDSSYGTTTDTTISSTATATVTAPSPPPGIQLDPNLRSATGTPSPEEMKLLIDLQAKVPYPVMAPTYLPGAGYQMETGLIGASGPTGNDPVGYYSYRYTDPANANRSLTFNQSRSNSKPQSGYYLTDVDIDGTAYQVYWHKTREYLPAGDPVRTDSVGDAETFLVVWQGQFTDASGQPQELYYSLSTGTWTGHDWSDIRALLASLRPLEQVGQ